MKHIDYFKSDNINIFLTIASAMFGLYRRGKWVFLWDFPISYINNGILYIKIVDSTYYVRTTKLATSELVFKSFLEKYLKANNFAILDLKIETLKSLATEYSPRELYTSIFKNHFVLFRSRLVLYKIPSAFIYPPHYRDIKYAKVLIKKL